MMRTARQVGLALGLAAGLLPAAAQADRALVVGVNTYPNLQGANLKGCVNDAQVMSQTLQKYGFQVTMITDGQATRDGIVKAIQALKAAAKPGERIVFYYAGHGTRSTDGKAVLLPSDAREGTEANDITADQLNQAIRAIPARSRTVLLDSCFSGGMMRSFKSLQGKRRGLQTRYYERDLGGPATKDLVKVNRTDDTDNVSGGAVCYFTASSANEQAGEDDFGAKRHGVFTYYLVERLTGARDRWGDVQSTVSGKVADHMEDTQHPRLTSAFVNATVFDGRDGPQPKPEPKPEPKPNTLWDDFNGDHVDRTKIEVVMEPNKTTMQVMEQLRFSIRAGAPGYLVILERGVADDIHLLYPESRRADDGRVAGGGRTISIPEPDKAYAPDAPGTERIRAILFTSKEKAQALLDQFPSDRSISRTQLMRKLIKVDTKRAPFYTSDITFEVVPNRQGRRR